MQKMSSRRSRAPRGSSAEQDRAGSSGVPGDDTVPDRNASADLGEHDASRSGDGDSGRDGDAERDRDARRDGDGDRRSPQRSDADRDSVKAAVLEVLADPEVIRQMVAAVSRVSGSASGSTPTSAITAASDGEYIKCRSKLRHIVLVCMIYQFSLGASQHLSTKFMHTLLAAGASPLGDMPSSMEVASLGLAVVSAATGAEDPLVSTGVSSVAGSSTSGKEVCSVVASSAAKGSKSAESVGSSAGFSLGHGFPLIPPKLVQKILKWEYVSMSELLPDNLELDRRSAEAQRGSSCSSKSPKKRDLTEDWKGLVAWSVSFNAFVAIVSRKHPSKFQELLAYHATILMEALRFGCKGWLSYDKMFREHVEKEPTSSWSMLHPMFYSLTFLSQRVEAMTCPRCMGPDHGKADCALASLESQQEYQRNRSDPGRPSGPARKRFRREGTPQSSAQTSGAPGKVNYCFSYNEGQCFRYPKPCDREHRCIRCGKDHKMVECTATFVPSSS